MPRDTNDTVTANQATLADLRRRLIDPEPVAQIEALKREVTKAAALRERCARAAANMAGLQGTAEELALATENEKALRHRLDRARKDIGTAADASVPELRQVAQQLADDAAALAALLRDIGEHVATNALRRNPTAGLWPGADASARGLAVLSSQLKG